LKKFLFILKIASILFIWYTNVLSSEKYPEPLYYTVYDTEDVIIKYSREVYHDIYRVRFKTAKQVNKRFKNKTHEEIELETILRVRSESSKRIKEKASIH